MSKSLTDMDLFLPPGTPMPPPFLVSSLLADLHLESAAREEQEAGIRGWLERNEPTPQLVRSMNRNGLAHLLGHPRAS